jgi:hypothetical protein
MKSDVCVKGDNEGLEYAAGFDFHLRVACMFVLQLKQLHKLDLSGLQFVGDSLKQLRQEVGSTAAVLGT